MQKIIVDTREKKWGHISAYFDRNGVEYEVKKLDVGDYMLPGGKISVDRKKCLNELSYNLTNARDKSRFMKEVRRSYEQGMSLYILCEHGGKIREINDLVQWKDLYSGVSGCYLIERLYSLNHAYGVNFRFCNKRNTGKKIIEILRQED